MSDADRHPTPRVTLKLATSLDGRIATASGESKWITGEAARAAAHKLRAEHDAVLVGSGTALADDPELTARTNPPAERQPLRIVADSRGRTPKSARIFATIDAGPVAIATREETDLDERGWPERAGIEYWMLPGEGGDKSASISISALLETAAGAGVGSILLEGGGELAAAFVRQGLVDRIEWFRAPILLGGDGTACLGGLGLAKLADAPQFERTAAIPLGRDLQESYVRAARSE